MKYSKEKIWDELMNASESALQKCIRDLDMDVTYAFMAISPEGVSRRFGDNLSKRLRTSYFQFKNTSSQEELQELAEKAFLYFENQIDYLRSSYVSEEQRAQINELSKKLMGMNTFQLRRWIDMINKESFMIFLAMLDEETKSHVLAALHEDEARIYGSFADLVLFEDYDTAEVINRLGSVLDDEKSPECIEAAKSKPPVIPNDNLFSTEDYSLALDYWYERRPLSKFEEERGRRVHEKIEELMDYFENTPLY